MKVKDIAYITVKCQHCNGKLSIPAGKVIELIACPICGKAFEKYPRSTIETLMEVIKRLKEIEEEVELHVEEN